MHSNYKKLQVDEGPLTNDVEHAARSMKEFYDDREENANKILEFELHCGYTVKMSYSKVYSCIEGDSDAEDVTIVRPEHHVRKLDDKLASEKLKNAINGARKLNGVAKNIGIKALKLLDYTGQAISQSAESGNCRVM